MPDLMIRVWRFQDAPEELQSLSTNGGDEDWLAVLPPSYPHWVQWLEDYCGQFGACMTDEYLQPDGSRVYIGSHA